MKNELTWIEFNFKDSDVTADMFECNVCQNKNFFLVFFKDTTHMYCTKCKTAFCYKCLRTKFIEFKEKQINQSK